MPREMGDCLMLKLTRNGDQKKSLYISPKHIVAMEQYGNPSRTSIWTTSSSHVVGETVEQIMAMPEMLYEMYPAIFCVTR